MDIRYIVWAGYDFLGVTVNPGGSSTPNIDSSVSGSKKIVARDLSPSLHGRFSSQSSERKINVFPGPSNL